MVLPFFRRLVVLHNLGPDSLAAALRLGGLPAPSLGITKAYSPYTDFGDMTLIGTRLLADPREGPVYACDAFTPAAPRTCRGDFVSAVSAEAAVLRMTSAAARKRRGPYNTGRLLAEAWGCFSDLEAVQAARDRIAAPDVARAAETRLNDLLDCFTRELASFHHPLHPASTAGRETLALKALVAAFRNGVATEAPQKTLEEALRRRHFLRVPARVLEIGLATLVEMRSIPIAYFEAKPSRLIRLEEFAGAVFPSHAPPTLTGTLRKAGLRLLSYNHNAGEAAHAAAVRALAFTLALGADDFRRPLAVARILFKLMLALHVSRSTPP